MTVEQFEVVGPAPHKRARVYHSFPEDPTMGVYVSIIEILGDHGRGEPTAAKVGTPLACPCPMSIIEVQAVIQLLAGRIVRLPGAPVDTVDVVEDQCPRRWNTYELTYP